MATIDNNVQADSEIIKSIFPYLNPNYSFCENMMKDGMYQRDRLVEFALARQSKGLYNTDSQDNWDFTDHSDSKSATINYRKSQGIHGTILISGVSSKEHLAKGPISLLLIPCLSIDIKPPLLVIISDNKAICL